MSEQTQEKVTQMRFQDFWPHEPRSITRNRDRLVRRGLTPAEVKRIKAEDPDAFKAVDEKGRSRSRG